MTGGINVFMALVDFVPVVLFFLAAVILWRDLYPHLSKGAYSLVAAGSIMVFVGGFYKALWKVLYALELCDYTLLDNAFFPMQGAGFLLFFLGLLGLFIGKKRKNADTAELGAAAPVVFTSSLPFIALQVIGLGGAQMLLAVAGAKRKNYAALIIFVLSFIFMLCMGYLGAKFDDSSNMHWLAQVTNILSLGSFLAGTLSLHRSGYDRIKKEGE